MGIPIGSLFKVWKLAKDANEARKIAGLATSGEARTYLKEVRPFLANATGDVSTLSPKAQNVLENITNPKAVVQAGGIKRGIYGSIRANPLQAGTAGTVIAGATAPAALGYANDINNGYAASPIANWLGAARGGGVIAPTAEAQSYFSNLTNPRTMVENRYNNLQGVIDTTLGQTGTGAAQPSLPVVQGGGLTSQDAAFWNSLNAQTQAGYQQGAAQQRNLLNAQLGLQKQQDLAAAAQQVAPQLNWGQAAREYNALPTYVKSQYAVTDANGNVDPAQSVARYAALQQIKANQKQG